MEKKTPSNSKLEPINNYLKTPICPYCNKNLTIRASAEDKSNKLFICIVCEHCLKMITRIDEIVSIKNYKDTTKLFNFNHRYIITKNTSKTTNVYEECYKANLKFHPKCEKCGSTQTTSVITMSQPFGIFLKCHNCDNHLGIKSDGNKIMIFQNTLFDNICEDCGVEH